MDMSSDNIAVSFFHVFLDFPIFNGRPKEDNFLQILSNLWLDLSDNAGKVATKFALHAQGKPYANTTLAKVALWRG